jgi:hypothetical protein
LAFGAATLFDITGAVIYRAFREQLPEPGPATREGPFQVATSIITNAHSEALMRARRGGADGPV